MAGIARISVSLEENLLDRFDSFIRQEGYPTRSEAVKALIRTALLEKRWEAGDRVAGSITIMYDHHRRNLVNRLIEIQHDVGDVVLASQHIHLDHANCLEVLVVQGTADQIRSLTTKLKSVKGVKHFEFSVTASGH